MYYQFRMPRHPLARLAAAVIGAIVLIAAFTIGLFAFAALAVVGAVWLLVRSLWPASVTAPTRPTRSPQPDVIEGEFTVVEQRKD
jgi:hypothetical protein